MEDLIVSTLVTGLSTFLAGSGITTIIITIINKRKDKGQRRSEFADFLDKMNTMFTNTIKAMETTYNTMESTYKSIIDSEQKAVEIANKNFEMSQQREERQLNIINSDRKRYDKLEKKNAKKRTIINKAYECDIVKNSSSPVEVCAVLKANSDYYMQRDHCETCIEDIKKFTHDNNTKADCQGSSCQGERD